MTFIRKIMEGNMDKQVHNIFSRFSVGEYDREHVYITNSKNLKVQTGFEYALDLYRMLIKDQHGMVSGKGVIQSSKKIEQEISAAGVDIKSSRGKKYTVEFELDVAAFERMLDELSDYFLMFTCSINERKLAVKTALPKPGSLKEKLCTLKIPKDDSIIHAFLPDVNLVGKKIEVATVYEITDIEIPEEYKDDFAMARKMAKRKGRVKRSITVDGETQESTLEFCA